MRFDPTRFSAKVEAWQESNRHDSNLFLFFKLIDLFNREVKIQNIDFDSFSLQDIDALLELVREFAEYGYDRKGNPEVHLFHPVHEYLNRYEVFSSLRNPSFAVYVVEDDFI